MNINESLLEAVRNGNANTVKALLADGADVNAKDDSGRTVLMAAASSGNTDIARLLLDAVRADEELAIDGGRACDADENIKTTLLGLRVEEDRKEARRAYVNLQDADGRTALMYAAWKGHADTVKVLIDAGTDVNLRDNEFGMTALVYAACSGNADAVKELLDAGAGVDVNARDNRGQTALMHAAEKGNADAVNMLLNAGADVNAQDKYGKTALMLASEKRHADAVKVLLEAGADVNAKDDNGETALSLATGEGHTAVADMLCSAGAR